MFLLFVKMLTYTRISYTGCTPVWLSVPVYKTMMSGRLYWRVTGQQVQVVSIGWVRLTFVGSKLKTHAHDRHIQLLVVWTRNLWRRVVPRSPPPCHPWALLEPCDRSTSLRKNGLCFVTFHISSIYRTGRHHNIFVHSMEPSSASHQILQEVI